MARIRTIKPGFFANEGLSEVSEPAQILAGGLLCYADDEGYFNAHPGLVKAAVFPLREPSRPVGELLTELLRIDYIRVGTGKDGKRYGHVVKFSEHQKVSHAIPSKIKEMGIVWEVSGKIPEDSMKSPEVLRPELNRIELNRNGNKRPSAHIRSRAILPNDSRHTRVKALLENAYRDQNKADCPWGAGEGKQLYLLLKEVPNWPDSQFSQCLQNMYSSAGFAKGTRPREFLPRLPKYLHGPLNEFNREQTNGAGTSKADRRNRDISETTARVFGLDSGATGHVPKSLPDKAT